MRRNKFGTGNGLTGGKMLVGFLIVLVAFYLQYRPF